VLIRSSRSEDIPTSSALPVGISAANEKLIDKQPSKKLVAARILRDEVGMTRPLSLFSK
jgi:hypothetical protein